MFFRNILAISALAFASVTFAAPTLLEDRSTQIEVFTNGLSTMITALDPAIITAELTGTKRQVSFSADAVVLAIITKVTDIIQSMIDSDVNRRKSFTQQVVGSAVIQFPGKNVVMSNVGYSFTGNSITTQRAVYNAKIGADVDYDVLVFDAGHTFTLQGDGGFQNWCYSIQSGCKVSGGGAILQC